MAFRIQIRRDSAANWTSENPILAQGELGYELDTGKLKIGNGTDDWTTLDYSFDESGDIASHLADFANPHVVTATQVGLGNVDNTSDIDKPVSTAQAAADTAVQSYSIQRSNHTGMQTASTISDFTTASRTAVVDDSITDSITDKAPSQNAVFDALAGKAASSHTHDLTDLNQSGATSGQVVKWNGSIWAPANEAGGGTWGSITGTLSDQTDLQAELDAKLTTPNSWSITNDYEGIASIVSVNVAQTGGGVNFSSKQANLILTEDNTDVLTAESYNFNIQGDFDLNQFIKSATTLQKFGTENLEYFYHNYLVQEIYEGTVNQLRAYDTQLSLGDGANVSSSQFAAVNSSNIIIANDHTIGQAFHNYGTTTVQAGAVVTTIDHTYGQINIQEDLNGVNLASYFVNVDAGVTVDYVNQFYGNPDIDGTVTNYNFVAFNGFGDGAPGTLTGLNFTPGFSGTMTNYYGVNLGMNNGDFTNFYGFNVSWGSAIDCNSFHGILMSPNIGTLDNYMAGLKFQPTGSNIKACDGIWVSTQNLTPYPGVQSSVTIQDLFYEANDPGSGFDAFSITYTSGGTAGAEVVTPAGNNISVQIEDGVSTAQNIKDALDANGTFTSIASVTITGTASNPQTVQGPTNLAGGEDVGNLRAGYFQGDVQIDGALSVGQLNGAFFQNLANGAGNPVSVHSLISGFTAEASTSYTLADAIGVNTASVMNFNANSSVTTAHTGISATVFPAVVQTHTGCSVDRVAGATFAISLDGSSTGGTLDIVSLCRSVAVPNGITTLSRLYGYEFDLPFGDPGTDTWGVYATPDVPSWFKGSILVGGSAGSGNDRPTNSSVGIELVSTTKAMRLSNMTTTERDALTALAGMVIFNTTTSAMEYYDGSSWV